MQDTLPDGARHAPATLRNRDAILDVLDQTLSSDALVLEIASGSGEHAHYFQQKRQNWGWQTSDPDAGARQSIDAWLSKMAAPAALEIDVMLPNWEAAANAAPNAIFCANMIHIAPPAATLGLIEGAGRLLTPSSLLILYGPFNAAGGRFTSPSNAQFDQNLKAMDPSFGIRDLGEVTELARQNGLAHLKTWHMPANNLIVVFRRIAGSPTAIPK